MPATMSSVTTMGYGNGTFTGSINLVPSLGYGLGEVTVTVEVRRRIIIHGISRECQTIEGPSGQRMILEGND